MIRRTRARAGATAELDFKRVFEGASGLVLVLAPDPEFTILGASDAWLRAAGTERERIVGRGLIEAFPPDPGNPHAMGAHALRASLERVLAGSPSDVMPVQKRAVPSPESQDGRLEERYWRSVNAAVRSGAGEILYLVHRVEDVTDFVGVSRLEGDAGAQATKAELEQVSRELESLSYAVSHDLRAPLRAIDGFSRILEEDYGDRLDGEGMRVISVIYESTARMGRLLDDVLALSRLTRKPLALEAIDMSRMAREAFEEVSAGAARPPELVLRPLPEARGDAPLIRQVWTNLLANAVKFSGPRARAVIEVSASESAAETVYSVRDNGVGFNMRYHDRLFGVFQKLHLEEEFPGTGIGLAIVQRVLVRHGGRVWGEGAPDAGATFHFSLPRESA